MEVEYRALKWNGEDLFLLDQRKLPHSEDYVHTKNLDDAFVAIKDMMVRGAPLIGFTGLWGLTLWLRENPYCKTSFLEACEYISKARPTAVNLQYEVDRLKQKVLNYQGPKTDLFKFCLNFTIEQMEQLEKANTNMASYVKDYLLKEKGEKKFNILTICNTGSLACGPIGTALGGIEYLHQKGLLGEVYACETRPYLQGSRLTSFELNKQGIGHKVIVEGATARLMQTKDIDAIFVGADRIAQNGDTANKIGTQMLSLLARKFNIPFIVMAPSSSFDLSLSSGEEIEIELRDENEVLELNGVRVAPSESRAWNPSFDITQAQDISAISCEYGLIGPVKKENIFKVLKNIVGANND